MDLTADALAADAPRIARLAGRALLADVRMAADRLTAGERDALHDFRVAVRRLRGWLRAFRSVLRETLHERTLTRLTRIADATRASRDLEVHLAWLRTFEDAHPTHADGVKWLVQALETRKRRTDDKLQRVLERDFDRTTITIDKALRRYTVDVRVPVDSFRHATARALRRATERAERRFARISSIDDRREAHAARIAAKRVRYLLEPLAPAMPLARSLVASLSRVQDDLGALHDAQSMRSLLDELMQARAPRHADTLKVIATRRARDERQRFAHIASRWRSKRSMPALWRQVRSIADRLEQPRAV